MWSALAGPNVPGALAKVGFLSAEGVLLRYVFVCHNNVANVDSS